VQSLLVHATRGRGAECVRIERSRTWWWSGSEPELLGIALYAGRDLLLLLSPTASPHRTLRVPCLRPPALARWESIRTTGQSGGLIVRGRDDLERSILQACNMFDLRSQSRRSTAFVPFSKFTSPERQLFSPKALAPPLNGCASLITVSGSSRYTRSSFQ
jgi:hypothetical protein